MLDLAMQNAMEATARNGQILADRRARHNADPRIARLRSMREALNTELGYGMIGAGQVFLHWIDGTAARRQRIKLLIAARMAQLDEFYPSAARLIKEAAQMPRRAI